MTTLRFSMGAMAAAPPLPAAAAAAPEQPPTRTKLPPRPRRRGWDARPASARPKRAGVRTAQPRSSNGAAGGPQPRRAPTFLLRRAARCSRGSSCSNARSCTVLSAAKQRGASGGARGRAMGRTPRHPPPTAAPGAAQPELRPAPPALTGPPGSRRFRHALSWAAGRLRPLCASCAALHCALLCVCCTCSVHPAPRCVLPLPATCILH